jgi:hypothetical protein
MMILLLWLRYHTFKLNEFNKKVQEDGTGNRRNLDYSRSIRNHFTFIPAKVGEYEKNPTKIHTLLV